MRKHLYLLSARIFNDLSDMKSAIRNFKSEYGAKCAGPAPFNLGLVYSSPKPVAPEDMAKFGLVVWE